MTKYQSNNEIYVQMCSDILFLNESPILYLCLAQSAALHTSKQETGEHLLMREILGSLLPAGSPQPSSPALHQLGLRVRNWSATGLQGEQHTAFRVYQPK